MTGPTGDTGAKGLPGGLGPDGYVPNNLLSLISVHFGGTCAIPDPGCYLCISADDPSKGCAACASGFKLVTQPQKGRRAVLGTKTSFKVPYCVGSGLANVASNDILDAFGKFQPAVNKISEEKLNALRRIQRIVNATLSKARPAL